MMKAICVLALFSYVAAQEIDYAQYVNPFIGSEGAIPGYACNLRLNHDDQGTNCSQTAVGMSLLEELCHLAW